MLCCFNDTEKQPYKQGVLSRSTEPGRRYIPWVWSRQIHETYFFGKIIGQGAFAVVHEALTMQDHKPYAIKVVARHRLNNPTDLRHFYDEIQILLDLRHVHIIHLHELYKNNNYFFLVMEKLNGGELFDRLCQKETYSEKEARDVMRTVFDAVSFCHEQGVAHRDLKPENLLLTSPDDDAKVKIADFGFAKRVTRPYSLTTRCGSPAYMAPELVNYKNYDERVDNWSLGVIVYTILGGYNPFVRDTVHLTLQEIRQANYQFPKEFWDGISHDAKKLIKALLTVDPSERITTEEALLHPWMTGRGDDLKQNKINLEQFKEFNEERKKQSQTKSFSVYWLVARR